MFGYVTVDRGQLTQDEYDAFVSYYCGVCRAIGKNASQTARLGLSYDITFLALVLSSVMGEAKTEEKRCIIHPVKKRKSVKCDIATDYAARAGVVLSYLKLRDDWCDEKKLKAAIGMLAFNRGNSKAKKQIKEQYELVKNQLEVLARLERENSTSIDDTADAFGKILEDFFVPDFIEGEALSRSLKWLGYNLGRWIYIIDAVNDFDEDKKTGSYNPFIAAGYEEASVCAEDIELSLTLTLDSVASAFELIEFKCNKDLIGKIIYIGLKSKQEFILKHKEKERKTDESI